MTIDEPGGGDRVVLVTGGAQGLGAAVCRQTAAREYRHQSLCGAGRRRRIRDLMPEDAPVSQIRPLPTR